MLHDPYIKLNSNADYDMYVLAEGVSTLHLAILHKEGYSVSDSADATPVDVDIPTSLKLLPLNHLVLAAMYLVDTATPMIDVDGHGDFASWIPAIADKLRGEIASMIVSGDVNDHFKFPTTTKNKIVKGFIEDRHMILLGVEHRGVLSRVYWLGRMNNDGDLSLIAVNEFGAPTKTTVTTDVSLYGISRASIPDILNYVTEYYNSNKPEATVVVEDNEPIGEDITSKL